MREWTARSVVIALSALGPVIGLLAAGPNGVSLAASGLVIASAFGITRARFPTLIIPTALQLLGVVILGAALVFASASLVYSAARLPVG